jgi:transcriptional repressor NrdR
MRCPHCGNNQHKVIDTREAGDNIRRRRKCEECGQRFTTYEQVSAHLLVVKSDGRREPYDRQKLLTGIQIASVKRPVGSDTIENIVEQIEDGLLALGRSEVPSSIIGNLVLEHLAHTDQVAYIRFASVYLDIGDLTDLRTEIERLMGR